MILDGLRVHWIAFLKEAVMLQRNNMLQVGSCLSKINETGSDYFKLYAIVSKRVNTIGRL